MPPMLSSLKHEFSEIYRFRYVVYSSVSTNLRIRYRRSVLGFVWTVLAPMLHYIIMGVVFSFIVKFDDPNYFVFYFSGAVLFGIISNILGRAPSVFIGNEPLIRKIYLPKNIFLLQMVGLESINFLLSATTLFILGLISGRLHLNLNIFWSLYSAVFLTIFLTGLSSLISLASVYFRDLINIVPVLIQAAFFLTPVIYKDDLIPVRYQWVLDLNPLVYYLHLFRNPMLYGTSPDLSDILMCPLFAIVALILGYVVVKKYENQIVFKL